MKINYVQKYFDSLKNLKTLKMFKELIARQYTNFIQLALHSRAGW